MSADLQLPLGKGVSIAAVQSGLVALNKPVGLLTHPNGEGDRDRSLLNVAYDESTQSYRWKGGGQLYVLNRIDSPTSGLVLCAQDPDTAERVRALFEERKVRKVYYAVIKGRPNDQKEWVDKMLRNDFSDTAHMEAGEGVEAITHYRFVERDQNGLGVNLVELSPQTGRTHQLRVQAAKRNCPIVGDRKYGDFGFNKHIHKMTGVDRLMLHAAILEVPLSKGDFFTAKASLPKEFQRLIRK